MEMRAGSVALLLFLLAPISAAQQDASRDFGQPLLTVGNPADLQVNAERLQAAALMVQHAVTDDQIPAALVFVARRGRIILHNAYGHRDADRTQPLRPDALFRMASNSKAITATGILLLLQDGKLQLDDPVARHLPAFDNDAWRAVTIRHLLTHTSGCRISTLFVRPLLETPDGVDPAMQLVPEVSRFASIPNATAPGATYSYNNPGFNILAAVIEQLTGSYQEFLQTRIYQPLGMVDSCNHESRADHNRMSTVMRRQDDGSWKAGWTPGDAPDWPFPRGSGGMVSSAYDYALFCQMLLNRGAADRSSVLTDESVRQMTTPQQVHCPGATTYGLGWRVLKAGGVFSHTGSDGTFVWVDPQRQLIGMLLTQTNNATIPRAAFRELVEQACTDMVAAATPAASGPAVRADGFYKDIFMSSGVNLTSRKVLPAAESLGLDYEYYAGADQMQQNQLLIGSPDDENGVLLYPDGEPRFRMLYVNGGGATRHGISLTRAGRDRLRQFSRGGGSYCGSCAGSFLSGRNVDQREELRLGYLHLFPFNTLNTGIQKTPVDHLIPPDSPLLKYRQFGDDRIVEGVYHNNGNWLQLNNSMQAVEVLASYQHPEHRIDGGAAIWAWQQNPEAGRIVNIGCHPEAAVDGEQLALTEACFLYALDGTGTPGIKATLQNGETREMSATTAAGTPEFTRIGDLQYHHFATVVTAERPWLRVELAADADVDLHLFLHRDDPAQQHNADFANQQPGPQKTLTQKLSPGRWCVGVFCATTVNTMNDSDSGFYRCTGDRSVLNGIPYQITVHHSADPPTDQTQQPDQPGSRSSND